MHTPPPNYNQYPIGKHREYLWLPNQVIEAISNAKFSEDDFENFGFPNDDDVETKIEKLIRQILAKNKISLHQLQQDLETFKKEYPNLKKTEAEDFDFKLAGMQYIKVFDTAAIKAQKQQNGLTRNIQSILKRFKDNDDGERELRCFPQHGISALEKLKELYPNCVQFLNYVISYATLTSKLPYAKFYFPPVLLVGPPGIGKTATANEVADITDVLCRQIDLASSTAGFILGGMSSQWADAKTGLIIDTLRDGAMANPIIILDEIDKASGDAKYNPLGPLYSLLEEKTAAKFIDEALDIPSDTSHINYVATANSLNTIPTAILSRFTVVEIFDITPEQHRQVSQSIYTSILEQLNCKHLFTPNLPDPVIEALRNQSPRVMKSTIRRALAEAAVRSTKQQKGGSPKHTKCLTLIPADLITTVSLPQDPGEYSRRQPIGFVQ